MYAVTYYMMMYGVLRGAGGYLGQQGVANGVPRRVGKVVPTGATPTRRYLMRLINNRRLEPGSAA